MTRSEKHVLVVGAVIVDPAGRAFVHRRGYDRALFPGQWDIPGGHVDQGEDPIDALRREIHEETGWRLSHIVCELGESFWTGSDGPHAASWTTWSKSRATSPRRASSARSTSSTPG